MRKIKIVLLLTCAYLAAEVVGGLLTGSLALIADAGHMLATCAERAFMPDVIDQM